ncbi:uncharacterized protein F5891DRAFT_1199182 [Suillus fuscotomentosus]|uniref:Uncharacterized protein n=1 Tax=Suillus fuscotomentosus TaxID=1912939 RepID=A0AAD4DPM2_9AGAM|nr:uncharacterized protein F5891DRAFT_1199182 [Suillus fuscotomentosus]KAG1888476.1 hypothetical protein F5891DRAFT_1199182 [Suillus fuscotomentosus]
MPRSQTLEVQVTELMGSDIRSNAIPPLVFQPPTCLPHFIAPVMVRHGIHAAGSMKTETTAQPRKTKRKAEESENDSKEAEKKFMLDEVDDGNTGTTHVEHKMVSVKTFNAVAPDAILADTSATELVNNKGFWDEKTRPVGWGLDSNIATMVELSMCYHPRQCDKCVKLKVPCIVLPDKKPGCIRLFCANCDEMKIACTIDSAGVRQRLQVKAKEAVGELKINRLSKCPRSCAKKPHPAAKNLAKSAPAKIMKPATCSSSCVAQTVTVDDPPTLWSPHFGHLLG